MPPSRPLPPGWRAGLPGGNSWPSGAPNLGVFFEPAALAAAVEHAGLDQRVECLGLLLGEVFHDPQLGCDWLYVRQALPARQVRATPVRVEMHREEAFHLDEQIDRLSAGLGLALRQVGWYHSHPGLGIFFSETDLATQRQSFTAAWQVGLVLDPVRGQYGLFCGPSAARLDPGRMLLAVDEHTCRPVSELLLPAQPVIHPYERPLGSPFEPAAAPAASPASIPVETIPAAPARRVPVLVRRPGGAPGYTRPAARRRQRWHSLRSSTAALPAGYARLLIFGPLLTLGLVAGLAAGVFLKLGAIVLPRPPLETVPLAQASSAVPALPILAPSIRATPVLAAPVSPTLARPATSPAGSDQAAAPLSHSAASLQAALVDDLVRLASGELSYPQAQAVLDALEQAARLDPASLSAARAQSVKQSLAARLAPRPPAAAPEPDEPPGTPTPRFKPE